MAAKLIFEQNIEGFSLNEMYGLSQQSISPPPFLLEVGNTYKVVWDGVEYEVVGIDVSSLIEGMVAVGNGTAFGFTGNNEPFIIGTLESDANFFSFDTETSHTVAIYQVVSSGLVLKDRNGNDLESIDGATEMRVPTADGGFRSFTAGERVKTTINPNFSNGDMVVTPNNGEVFSEVTVKKPDGLVPGAIAKDVVVAGIVGEYEGGSDEGFVAMLERTIVDLVAPDVTLAAQVCIENKTLQSANVYSCGDYCFHACSELVSVTINGESMSMKNTFSNCKKLETFSAPNLTTIPIDGCYGFAYCSSLKSFHAPKALLQTASQSMFTNCTALTEFVSTVAEGYHAFGYGMFMDCTSLQKVDISANLMLNNNYIFKGCTALTTIIMRGGRCFKPYGDVTSTWVQDCPAIFYVPSSVYADYEANTKWKTFIDAGRLFCIEDYPDICG